MSIFRIRTRFVLFSFLVLFRVAASPVPASAQEMPPADPVFDSGSGDPAWVLLERGKAEFSRREYGEALSLFRQAVGRRDPYPEAELLIGMVFEQEGNYPLAELQYGKVWDQRELLEVPEMRYDVLRRLSGIYLTRRQFNRYEETLLQIVKDDRRYAAGTLPDRFVRTLGEQGLDKLLELYRIEPDFAADAQSDLGYFYYLNGRYAAAVRLLTFSGVKNLSRIIDSIRSREPDFEYRGIREALASGYRYPEIERFILSTQVYRTLFYLADSLYGDGSRRAAEALWNLLARERRAGEWAARAERQLVKPNLEPFLVR